MRISLLIACAIAVTAHAVPAGAQAITPMRGEVRSTTDQFAVRVYPANPYTHRIKIEVKVYDETFQPVQATVMPPQMMVAPSDMRGVLVMVPFEGRNERKVRICAESIPLDGTATRIRTQVCGRFFGQRLQ